MEHCRSHHGSGIGEVLGEGIEALISVEKLRGTDLCLGAIGAQKSGSTPVLAENSLYRLRFQMTRKCCVVPCGAPMPCTAGSSKVLDPSQM